MMKRGIFEEVEGLSIVSISDINFEYNTNMEGYTTLSSDIPKLCAIHWAKLIGNVFGGANKNNVRQ